MTTHPHGPDCCEVHQPLDPAAIMAEHADNGRGWCTGCRPTEGKHVMVPPLWPCEPYCLAEQIARLAAELAAERERVRRVGAVVEETEWGDPTDDDNRAVRVALGRLHSRLVAALAGERAADRRCDWDECPGRPADDPIHEHEAGPELHVGCRRLLEEQGDAQAVKFGEGAADQPVPCPHRTGIGPCVPCTAAHQRRQGAADQPQAWTSESITSSTHGRFVAGETQ